MAIVELTKKQIIEALKKEPRLRYGRWVGIIGAHGGTLAPHSLEDVETLEARSPRCTFCAVGAVVRSAMSRRASVVDVEGIACEIGNDSDSPMFMLSDRFEGAMPHALVDLSSKDAEDGRWAAIEYVREEFPPKIRIDIGRAKPRRGMKVVG